MQYIVAVLQGMVILALMSFAITARNLTLYIMKDESTAL